MERRETNPFNLCNNFYHKKLYNKVERICRHPMGPTVARSTRIPARNYVPQYTAMDGLNFRRRRRNAASCKEAEFSHGVTRR